MRKVISMLSGAAFVIALAIPAFAADMTVKGEAHAGCAMSCAKGGQPVGILTADAVYTVTGDYAANKNAKLLDFVAKNVIVTGEVTEKDGQKMINVKSIKLVN